MSRVDWRDGFLENSLNFLECQEAKGGPGVTLGCHKRACS